MEKANEDESNWMFIIYPTQDNPRFLPDTLQTPQNIEYLVQSEATGRKRNKLIEISLTGWLSIAFTSFPPDSIQSHSDNPRHLPDTFQTP